MLIRLKLLELKVSMLSFNYQNQSSGVVLLQKQPPEVFCKKSVLRNFAKFTGKHLCTDCGTGVFQ